METTKKQCAKLPYMHPLKKLPLVPVLALLIFASAGVLAQKGRTTGDVVYSSGGGGGEPPSAPTNLSANGGVAAQEIVLTWTGSSGATGYIVLQSTSSSGTFSQIATPSSNTYTDSGLANGATFYYEVEATNSYGTSGASNQASAITLPATPTGQNANGGVAPQTVALSWTGSTGASSYNVLRSTSSGGTYSGIGSSSTASYSDTTAASGTTYYYEVAAVDASGSSGDSTFASALTLPAAPTVTATGGDTIASVTWSAVGSATSYTMSRSNTQGGQPVEIWTLTDTNWTDAGLTDGSTYYYSVYATNASGNSSVAGASAEALGSSQTNSGITAEYAYSTNQRVTENDPDVDVMSPPNGITQGGSYPNVWSATWSGYLTAPKTGAYTFGVGGSWYEWGINVNGTGYGEGDAGPPNNGQPFPPSISLTAGQKYPVVVTVTPLEGSQQSGHPIALYWSVPNTVGPGTVVPSSNLTPAVPALTTPSGLVSAPGGPGMSLSWNDSQSVGCYAYRATQSGAENYAVPLNSALADPAQQGGQSYTYLDYTVQANQEYCYTIRGAYSNPVTGGYTLSTPSGEAAQAEALYAPDFIQVMATSASSIRVYFQPVAGATAYNIYRSTTSGGETTPVASVPVVTGNEHFYDDSGLTAYQDYYYQVTAVSGTSESPMSPEDSHYPNPNAIPWNGSNADILAAALGNLNTEPGLPYAVPAGNSSISTPDGQLIEDGDAGATIVPLDAANWKKIVGPYTIPIMEPVWVVPQSSASKTTVQEGAFRRMLSVSGAYTGTVGWVNLPNTTDVTNFVANRSASIGYTDVPMVFVGIHSGSIEADAGIEFNPATTDNTLPDRFSPYINIYADGDSTIQSPIYSFKLGTFSLDKTNSKSYIYGADLTGNNVFLGIFIDPDKRMLRFYCFAVDAYGNYVATTLNAAANFKVYGNQPIGKVDMKRVTGIPQSIVKASQAFTGLQALVPEPAHAQGSYYPSGSIFNSTYFNAALLSNGSYSPWTRTLANKGGPTSDDYTSANATASGDPSSANGELDAVHH